MNDEKTETDFEETGRPRIRLSKYVTNLVQGIAGEEKVTSAHLDELIRELQQEPSDNNSAPDWVKTQLDAINTNLVTLRYMIRSLAAETEEEVQKALEDLNRRMTTLQIESAKETNLDHPALKKIAERMEDNQRLHQILNQGPMIEEEKAIFEDRER